MLEMGEPQRQESGQWQIGCNPRKLCCQAQREQRDRKHVVEQRVGDDLDRARVGILERLCGRSREELERLGDGCRQGSLQALLPQLGHGRVAKQVPDDLELLLPNYGHTRSAGQLCRTQGQTMKYRGSIVL